jgi:bifunctional DNA-binding transcriptional regulator/antitoxin component of YhaV-PrlF toxin-antitoxin module
MARISSKHQVTLPVESLRQAGLGVGDEVAIEAEGDDRIVVRDAHVASFDRRVRRALPKLGLQLAPQLN